MPKRVHPLKIAQVSYNSGTMKCYKHYCRQCDKFNKTPLEYKEWRAIVLEANELLADKILEGKHIKLPFLLSSFLIAEFKQKVIKKNKRLNLPIDWQKTKELGTYVYHTNSHTNGKLLKFFWHKSDASFKYKEIYAFKVVRKVSRAIAPLQKSEDKPQYIALETVSVKKKTIAKYPKDIPVVEFDGKTKQPVKRWNNYMELLKHYEVSMAHFTKLISLPSKRWLRGKTYLVYDFKNEYEHIQ